YGYKDEQAQQKAIRLKKILDGKGLRIDMTQLSKNEDYVDSTSVDKKHIFVLFPKKFPEIYLEKIGNNWYYSAETIDQINQIYESVYPWGTSFINDYIPEPLHKSFLNFEIWQYLGFLILILIGVLIYHLFKRLVYFILTKVERVLVKNTSEAVNQAINRLSRPLTLIFAFWIVEKLLPILQMPLNINRFLLLGLEIAKIVFWIYVFLKLVAVVMQVYADIASKTESKLDDQIIPILKNLLRGLVMMVGVYNLLKILGVDTTTLIAGISIGGLALALASQDTVKNLIGTFMIFLDHPFQIGDWIEAGVVAGTVEEVGFRSTRVRAADTSLFQIPNSALAEMIVNNKGLLLFRRYNTQLGLRYDTPPELIEAFVDGVREIIKVHPDTRSDAYNVEFVGFGDSALLILLNTYFTDLGWNEEQSSRHRLHIAILKFAKEIGVEFAFPSTSVIIEQFPEKKGLDLNYKIDSNKIEHAIKNAVNKFKIPQK
ncbi:MAG: mechanosensitive ion channel protein MscS, partial [Flavobacteriales bacterium CG_4_9_14_0_2_um_filter_35_242]